MMDKHHELFERPQWMSGKASRRLRTNHEFIVSLDRDLHEEIHRNCPPVPMLGSYALARTLQALEPGRNPIHSIEQLQRAFEVATRGPRSHPLERDLGGLAIEALDFQKPYIKEGIILL